jgi:hypothetical protein
MIDFALKSRKNGVMNKPGLLILILLASISFNFSDNTFGQVQQVCKSIEPFFIMAHFSLKPEQLDLDHFKELADAGFTVNLSILETPEQNKKALKLAQQVGIKLIIYDSRIQPGVTIDKTSVEKIDQVVSDYKDYPALWGYYICDEPTSLLFESLSLIKNQINLRDPLHNAYVNLLPDYANTKQLGTVTYKEYVDKFIQVFHPQYLSYDYYPFTEKGFRKTYYQNLEVVRTAALNAGIPFLAFTMSCQIDPAYPKPTEAWIRLQLYSDLAYGAKGLQYFTYALPHSTVEDFKTAILDDSGKKTYLHDIAKRVNSEICALGSTINNLNSIDVYNSEPLPKGTKPFPVDFHIKSISGGQITAGYFKDDSGQSFVLLVNRNYEDKSEFKIMVSEKVKGLEEISKFSGEHRNIFKTESGEIRLQFNSGDGRLFRVID